MKKLLVMVNMRCDTDAFTALTDKVAKYFPQGKIFPITDECSPVQRSAVLCEVENHCGIPIIHCANKQLQTMLLRDSKFKQFTVTIVPVGRTTSSYREGYPFYIPIDGDPQEIVSAYMQFSTCDEGVVEPLAV